MIRVSVVVPVYNVQIYLRDCLETIQSQTFTDFEVICVDDGSTDGSGDILNEYARTDMRFKVVHQKNAGAWAARNAALEMAAGEWVAFVDADDMLNPNWLAEGLRIEEESCADLVRLGYTYGCKLPLGFADRVGGSEYQTLEGGAAAGWMWNTMMSKGFLWSCFIRRDLVRGLKFLPRINCKEDSVWLLELAPKVQKIAQGDFKGYFYRAAEGSLTKCNRKVSQCVFYLKAMKSLWDRQNKQAAEQGWLEALKANVRKGADHDVIEWVMKRARPDDLPPKEIRAAYRELEQTDAWGVPYADEKRYRFGFWWWRKTGQIWGMRSVGLLFLFLRKMINLVVGG